MRAQIPKFLFVLASFAALAVFPHVASKFGVDLATKIMIFRCWRSAWNCWWVRRA